MAQNKRMKIAVAVTTYNHKDAIGRCLKSLAAQRGEYDLEAWVFDDCSTDETGDVVRQLLKDIKLPANVRITYVLNKKNLGMQGNLRQVLDFFANGDSDFCCILEGDDYWLSADRIQRHVDLLTEHPEYAFSFNALLLYEQADDYFHTHPKQEEMRDPEYTASDLAQENFIANLSTTFYRTENVRKIPLEIFDEVFVADWIINIIMAQEMGSIGYINEPLTVYRLHENGVWSGESWHKKNRQTLGNAEFLRARYPGKLDGELDVFLSRYIQAGDTVASLYWSTPNMGFGEKTRLRAVAEWDDKKRTYTVRFPLDRCAGATAMRFDPIEGHRIRAKIHSILCEGKPVKISQSNGLLNHWFRTTDPWYRLAPASGNVLTVEWEMYAY